ncbi:MAG TPA: AAA family ATPase [Candidatus Acidoferrales bacterium]
MFLEYFGLIEQPFGVTPDPRFLHMGAKHREALASLWYGTDCNRGFLALIAEPGMGKTSLLYQYLEGLRGKARTAFIFQTDCNARDFMRHILSELGIEHDGKNLPSMQAMLNEVLLAEMKAGRRLILVIDEAQNLEERVLESVRLLSNFETPWMKLMQIVIAGQPQLAEHLSRPSMAQLRQRISAVIRLEPFTAEEINSYIDHRLWVASYSGGPLFTVGARVAIAKYSRGIPRNINTLCFNAMSVAYGMNVKQVDARMVQEAAADVEMESLLPKTQKLAPLPVPAKRVPVRSAPVARPVVREIPARATRSSARLMVPAFAGFCALMLLATFFWVAWERGERTPPFDTLMASTPPAALTGPGLDATQTSSLENASGDTVQGAEMSGAGDQAVAAEVLGVGTMGDEAAADRDRVRSAVPAGWSPASITAGLSHNDEILTIVVEREVTLRQLATQYIGRFDEVVLEEIFTLNPDMHRVGSIEIGQRMRLPLYLRKEFKRLPQVEAQNAPLEAVKELR